MAEAADTSEEKAAELHETLWLNRHQVQVDTLDRIDVIVEPVATSYTLAVMQKIQSMGGTVRDVPTARYFMCWIHPRELWRLLDDENVIQIRTMAPSGGVSRD